MKAETERKPVNMQCVECEHCWVAAYTPMNAIALGKLLGSLHCPMCAAQSNKIKLKAST